MSHGDGPPLTIREQVWLAFSDDPRLALVHADLDAWHEEHPCTCDALCVCEETQ